MMPALLTLLADGQLNPLKPALMTWRDSMALEEGCFISDYQVASKPKFTAALAAKTYMVKRGLSTSQSTEYVN